LRAAAARTIPDLWQAIADALRRFTPRECANYLAAAGYDATPCAGPLASSSLACVSTFLLKLSSVASRHPLQQ
jgi:hypothetical protein